MENESKIHDKIRDAQRKIVTDLVACESAIAALYDAYSKCFPEYEELWSVMADEERNHAQALGRLHGVLDQGHIFKGIGRFTPQAMKALMDYISEETRLAPDRTIRQAAASAVRLENSLLESHFYDVVDTDAKEFKTIAHYLTEQTRAHSARISYVLGESVNDSEK